MILTQTTLLSNSKFNTNKKEIFPFLLNRILIKHEYFVKKKLNLSIAKNTLRFVDKISNVNVSLAQIRVYQLQNEVTSLSVVSFLTQIIIKSADALTGAEKNPVPHIFKHIYIRKYLNHLNFNNSEMKNIELNARIH